PIASPQQPRTRIGEGSMKTAFLILAAMAASFGIMAPAAQAQAPAPPPPPPDGARYIVTYLEVMPTARANAMTMVRQFRDATRKEAGNLRAEAVTQTNRQNHFTVIELWRDSKAAEAHSMAPHTRAFREKLGPASGALYDERFYKVLE